MVSWLLAPGPALHGDLWLCPLAVSQYLLSHSMSHCQVLFKRVHPPKGMEVVGDKRKGSKKPMGQGLRLGTLMSIASCWL